ncbi:MAG: relaxase/mobilization nuclease domain-containing protein [Ruminococcus sp.]|nr:relaxase/mobilization nuclease domain-containing protein [Ruminococcus sp.]
MPYVKSISVHSTPKKTIAYIVNDKKTDNLLYVSGLNCSAAPDVAYEEMRGVFEEYSKHSFSERKAVNSKTPVKLFHFVQSFHPNENITPEKAHSIAKEWAEKAFGAERQIIVSTHTDKGHIHSHIVLNPYDFYGVKFNSNRETLKAVRGLSDTVCMKYNIKPISSKGKKGVGYKEWSEKKKGSSWKQQIRETVDRLVYESENLDDLLRKLNEQGYKISRKKYITITTPKGENKVRTKTLGEGYDEDSLVQRIALAREQSRTEKEDKINEEIARMPYMERLYNKRIYEVSQLVRNGEKVVKKYNPKLPYSVENDYEVFRLARQLLIIKRDGITSANDLEKRFEETEKAYEDCRNELNNLAKEQEQFKLIIENAEKYFELSSRDENTLTQAEKLKLKISGDTVRKCGIKSKAHVEIIRKAYEDNAKKSAVLNDSFGVLEQRFKEYADILERYKQISQKDYITRLIEEKKRKAGKLE